MVCQWLVGREGTEKVIPLLCLFVVTAYVRLYIFQLDNYIVFFSKLFKLNHQLGGIYYVNNKNAEKQSDDKAKRQIFRKPFQCAQNIRVN